jgi:NAD(P)H-hydrate epimerase
VLSAEEMRAWDQHTIATLGVAGEVLMETAGRGLAAVVQRLYPRGPVLVLCGSGNNGGDGVVAARTLAAWGREVSVHVAGGHPPAAALEHGWELPRVTAVGVEMALARAAVVVDALLGTGSAGRRARPMTR